MISASWRHTVIVINVIFGSSRFLSALLLMLLSGAIRSQTLINSISGGYNDADCALMLSGGGRSSAFDYNLNVFRGTYEQMQQHQDRTCITYGSINNAYLDARKRISKLCEVPVPEMYASYKCLSYSRTDVAAPHGEWKTEDIATVGELLLDMSIQLART